MKLKEEIQLSVAFRATECFQHIPRNTWHLMVQQEGVFRSPPGLSSWNSCTSDPDSTRFFVEGLKKVCVCCQSPKSPMEKPRKGIHWSCPHARKLVVEETMRCLPRSLEICRDSCGTRSIYLDLLHAPSKGQSQAVILSSAPRQ